jgi:type VI secretion system ImpC/EvpB family protein
MPLNSLPYGDYAFASVRSLQKPPLERAGRDTTPAAANARLSGQINSLLCVSRFAHYIKVMGRDMVGSLLTPVEVERRLQAWLSAYTNTNLAAAPDTRALYPLVASRVTVHELPARPGAYGCVLHLQPHYQLDSISTVFRLVTTFVAPDTQ